MPKPAGHALPRYEAGDRTGYPEGLELGEIAGAVSGNESARLRAIADRCPVHATLTHEIKIRTRLVT